MSNSEAVSEVTVGGVVELVRRWPASGERLADVVLVHGLGEHSGRHERMGDRLSEAGMNVVSFDLVGFGASGGGRGDIADWTIYLDQVQRHVEAAASPVVLMGQSMGGLIALEYALADRPAPNALVLTSPALGGGKAWQRALAPMLAKIAPGLKVPNKISGDQLSHDPAVGEAYFADPLVITASTARLGSELFAAIERTRAALDRLDIPTLVLHGSADTVVPPTASAVLADRADRRLYLDFRHETFNEPDGERVVTDIIDWVRQTLG